jgi:predicted RNase H-like HicB family nuclease
MKFIYPAVFTPFADEEGFTVEVPDLPGCITEGKDLAEAFEMGIDAAAGWILGEIEAGSDFPAASKSIDDIPAGSFVKPLILDIDISLEKSRPNDKTE